MARQGRNAGNGYEITAREQVEALASPLRQELVDTLEQHGPLTIQALGTWLERAPDGLYYHVRRLVALGLLREVDAVPSGGREAQRYDVAGRPMRILHRPGDAAHVAAVKRTVATLLRVSARDAHKALDAGIARLDRSAPDFFGMRSRARLDAASLARVRELLAELSRIAHAGQNRRRGRVFSLTFLLTPLVPPRQRAQPNEEST
ncbi:MAG: helix-turn-helix transcriptional regulator [Planctomycetes bacterium]|nr:helix-turn-helix transcriptional regulator [Planctomycetota bacterium]